MINNISHTQQKIRTQALLNMIIAHELANFMVKLNIIKVLFLNKLMFRDLKIAAMSTHPSEEDLKEQQRIMHNLVLKKQKIQLLQQIINMREEKSLFKAKLHIMHNLNLILYKLPGRIMGVVINVEMDVNAHILLKELVDFKVRVTIKQ